MLRPPPRRIVHDPRPSAWLRETPLKARFHCFTIERTGGGEEQSVTYPPLHPSTALNTGLPQDLPKVATLPRLPPTKCCYLTSILTDVLRQHRGAESNSMPTCEFSVARKNPHR